MDLTGKPVLFRLSRQGREALRDLVPRKGSFHALVLSMDDIGAWVFTRAGNVAEPRQTVPVVLLKSDYIVTAAFEFRAEGPPARRTIGFTGQRES